MTRQEAYERMVVAQDAYYAILPAFKTAEAKLRRNRRSGAAAEAYLAARDALDAAQAAFEEADNVWENTDPEPEPEAEAAEPEGIQLDLGL